jgi:hypothetical protein
VRLLISGRELDIIVIVIQLNIHSLHSLSSGAKGKRDVAGADNVVPEAGAVSTVFEKCFVDDVPGIAVGAPVLDQVGYVVDEVRVGLSQVPLTSQSGSC